MSCRNNRRCGNSSRRGSRKSSSGEPIAFGLSFPERIESGVRPLNFFEVGDPIRLRQVLGNLLHNAGKYTDPAVGNDRRIFDEPPDGTYPDLAAAVDALLTEDAAAGNATAGAPACEAKDSRNSKGARRAAIEEAGYEAA